MEGGKRQAMWKYIKILYFLICVVVLKLCTDYGVFNFEQYEWWLLLPVLVVYIGFFDLIEFGWNAINSRQDKQKKSK